MSWNSPLFICFNTSAPIQYNKVKVKFLIAYRTIWTLLESLTNKIKIERENILFSPSHTYEMGFLKVWWKWRRWKGVPFEWHQWNILRVLILMKKDFSGVKIHSLIIASPTKPQSLGLLVKTRCNNNTYLYVWPV